MANLRNAPRWLLQLFRALFMIFLIVEKAILHAIGFELVAFTTGVMPCRSKITSAPANVLPVLQTSVEDCSKPNIGSQYRHRLGKQATDWRVLVERSAGVAIDELRMVLEGVIQKSRWYFLRLSRRCQAASDITGSHLPTRARLFSLHVS